MQCLAWLTAILLAVLSAAGPAWSRGGGGCIREGTSILTPSGMVAVESLKVGDEVLGVNGARLESARVEATVKLKVDRYLEILTGGGASLVLTPEHPVMVGPGVFRAAREIRPGDRVYSTSGEELREERVSSVRPLPAEKPAYNLLVNPHGIILPNGVAVHNKGCFLPDSPILRADGLEVPISSLRPGDEVLAFTSEGRLVPTTVRNILIVEVDRHVILTTNRGVLRVTPDHPFFVGRGTFKTLEALRPGETVLAWDGQGLTPQRILSMETVPGRIQVYNLQADPPHTFFAGGLAVHNKGGGGGGGCFPPGTPVSTPGGPVPIERLSVGDRLIGVDSSGKPVEVRVETIHETRAGVFSLNTDLGALVTTAEHPVKCSGGDFMPAGQVARGTRLEVWEDGKARSAVVREAIEEGVTSRVYNLSVSEPHVFLASGFIVHNKGGSSSSSRSGASSSGGGGEPASALDLLFIVGFLAVWVGLFVFIFKKARAGKRENLDFLYSASDVARKADRTAKLLQFLSTQDPSVAPDALATLAESVFRKLQECWQKREYDPMGPLLMPSLYDQHVAQLRGLAKNHETNRIEDLQVEKVDLVNVRYTEKLNQREFTALITASARDYYVDDRTAKFLRGDKTAAKFQEFWTFQRLDNRWLVRDIEQAGESDYLKDENFAEMLTDQSLQGIYGEEAGKEAAAGPWIEKGVEKKATRIERMLNFLAQTDKLWNRQAMLERARQVFLAVYLARESGDPAKAPAGDLFPEVAASLREQLKGWQAEAVSVEYRNLCVRKVELILVRNFQERAKDEYTVRISAHAQRIVTKAGRTTSEDKYVSPFEDYWTFGRLDDQWKLKEVLPPAEGERRVGEENVDEDTPAGQIDWYYRQTRAT